MIIEKLEMCFFFFVVFDCSINLYKSIHWGKYNVGRVYWFQNSKELGKVYWSWKSGEFTPDIYVHCSPFCSGSKLLGAAISEFRYKTTNSERARGESPEKKKF